MAVVRAKFHSWNVTVGNFFFRYRNALFPLVFIFAALSLKPKIMFGSPPAEHLLSAIGIVVALLGETVRFVTIGFEYIHRGGKDGRVYAGRLVTRGIFGLVRNPMYIGNALIATGMTMYFGAPLGYLILIPFFLFVYQALIAAEEFYLGEKFGSEYADYCANVNRFFPRLSNRAPAFSGMCFHWRRGLKKDLGTIVGLTMGFILVPAWRTYSLEGWDAAKAPALSACEISIAVTVIYLVLLKLKRTNRLFQD
jgi:protein-S-isoprenylcysteine O-methyltransferase Ste14